MSNPADDVLREAQLSAEEVDRILRICGEHALLVGGQALATWALYYNVEPAGELSRAITMDADFIGTRDIARALQRRLGEPWRIREGTLDDAGGQVAKVYATLAKEGIKQVAFPFRHCRPRHAESACARNRARARRRQHDPCAASS